MTNEYNDVDLADQLNSTDLHFYYKTEQMDVPTVVWQKSGDKLTVMTQFMPTFQKVQPQEQITFTPSEDEPEEEEIKEELKKQIEGTCFIFAVDRSGSMSGTKMEVTNEAMKLFIKSLPAGSKFQIVGFGSSFQWL